MVSSVNNSSLLSYLSNLTSGSSSKDASTTAKSGAALVSQAALQRAAGTTKSAAAVSSLEAAQKTLSTDLRAALEKSGTKLTGAVEFTIKSDGSVSMKGNDADKAAMKAFLGADTSKPSFATRIATQAKDALKLSTTIQQSAAISQAAKVSKSSAGVISMYTSFMQQASASSAVYSLSATASSLTYPGSLSTNA